MDPLFSIFYIIAALVVLALETYSLIHKNWQSVSTKFAFAEGVVYALSIVMGIWIIYTQAWAIVFLYCLATGCTRG